MTTQSFITFTLNNTLYGLNIDYVREINRYLDLSPVPHAPKYIHGLLNLRGQIVTVMDLKKCIGLSVQKSDTVQHNVIIKTDAERQGGRGEEMPCVPDKLGFLVDDIADVVTVDTQCIDPPPANVGQVDRKFLAGVVQLEETLLTLLSLNAILIGA